MIVEPEAALALTVTTKLTVVVAFAARVPMLQVRVPRVHPVPVKENAVVPGGGVSVKLTLAAAAGPPLVTI